MAFDFGRSFDRDRQLLLACTFAFSIACAVAKNLGHVPNCYKKRLRVETATSHTTKQRGNED